LVRRARQHQRADGLERGPAEGALDPDKKYSGAARNIAALCVLPDSGEVTSNPLGPFFLEAAVKRALALLALFLFPLSAQQTKNAQDKEPPIPVFKSGTVYVQVPVIVHRGGKHVSGLKVEHFVVRQDGKPQPIASLEEVHRGPEPASSANATTTPGQSVADPSPAQMTIVAIDMVNTPNLERSYFIDQIQRYFSNARRSSGPIGLIAIERSGIRLLGELTTDPALILTALKGISSKATSANNDVSPASRSLQNAAAKQLEEESLDVGTFLQAKATLKFTGRDESAYRFQDRSARMDMQLAIQQLAQALKGIPGRKTLLLVGSGFKFIDTQILVNPIAPGKGASIDRNVENAIETLDQTAYTWKLLNDANVAVYPIDTRRTVNTAFENMDPSMASSPSRMAYEQSRQADLDTLESFRMMAAQTGGKPCIYRTDLDNCVREAVEDDYDYYMLGFYADKDNRKPGWHSIEVRLKDQKGNVRHRQGFMLATFNPELQRRTDISLALQSPFAYTDLMIRARFDEAQQGKDGKKLVPFHIMVPPGGIVPEDEHGRVNFDIVAIARAEGGKQAGDFNQHVDRRFPAQSLQEIRTIGVDFKNSFELASGEYAVWFVVRDNISGRTGSSVVRLKVP
jgi:VWFA-related protein